MLYKVSKKEDKTSKCSQIVVKIKAEGKKKKR